MALCEGLYYCFCFQLAQISKCPVILCCELRTSVPDQDLKDQSNNVVSKMFLATTVSSQNTIVTLTKAP